MKNLYKKIKVYRQNRIKKPKFINKEDLIMEKHIMITGTSTISWKDAILQTIDEASKTIDYLTGVTIVNQKAKINGKKIIEYYVDVDLTFMIDRDRK